MPTQLQVPRGVSSQCPALSEIIQVPITLSPADLRAGTDGEWVDVAQLWGWWMWHLRYCSHHIPFSCFLSFLPQGHAPPLGNFPFCLRGLQCIQMSSPASYMQPPRTLSQCTSSHTRPLLITRTQRQGIFCFFSDCQTAVYFRILFHLSINL